MAGKKATYLYASFATIAWCAWLNAMWLAFTLLGGVVLGAGPATVAACVLSRRRIRGESVGLRDFAAVWRREFVRGSIVVLSVFALVLLLFTNYVYLSAMGPQAGAARLATLAALAFVLGAGSYVAPMYAHYDLRPYKYLTSALRFALARPLSTFLLLFVFAAFAFVSAVMPVLPAVISFGAWWQVSTWLCLRFFQENEDRLAAPSTGPTASNRPGQPSLPGRPSLPAEPLRIR